MTDTLEQVVDDSRRNNFDKAFREVGRVIRTVALLRFLSDPQLRRRTTAETNKVESYNRFSDWCRFGNHRVIAANHPEEQEKILKFSTLLTMRSSSTPPGHDGRGP